MSNSSEAGVLSKIKDRFLNFLVEAIGWTNPGKKLIQWLLRFFLNTMISIFGPTVESVQEFVNDVKQIPEKIRKFKKMIKAIKAIIRFLKAFIKAVCKILIKTLVQVLTTPVGWVILGIIIVLILFSVLFGRFGSFKGEFVVDMDKMREMNQDLEEYTVLLNEGALREAFYESISDTSFYQTFNLTDMEGSNLDLSSYIIADLANMLTDNKQYSVTNILATKKCTTSSDASCIYENGNLLSTFTMAGISAPQLDKRYSITDANMNPAKYLIQAESLGTYSDSYGLTSYFRDYWNREENFTISADFLYELNRWIYETDRYPKTEQIVYPEAFVQPVSFVNDYLRIQNDPTSEFFGQSYVYVTQRVTLDDIKNPSSEFYDKYQYEGIIKSTPSDIVYDYVVANSNYYKLNDMTSSSNTVNIGNPADYVTIKNKVQYTDGTYDETDVLMKLYWVVNPLYMNDHMGNELSYKDAFVISNEEEIATNYYYIDSSGEKKQIMAGKSPFIGPFLDPYTISIDDKETICFGVKLNEYCQDGVSAINSTRKYVYTAINPNLINNAFVITNDYNIKFVDYVIDFSKSIGSNINANEVLYYDGSYYQYVGLPTTISIELFESNPSLFNDILYFVKIPHLIDYSSSIGEDLYPGDILYVSQQAIFKYLGEKETKIPDGAIDTIIYILTDHENFQLITSMDDNNFFPTKHYQLAQIADEGEIVSSSRNLINKTYLKKKTIRPAYRNSDEYWDAFESFISEDQARAPFSGSTTAAGECRFTEVSDSLSSSFTPAGEAFYNLKYCKTSEKDSCDTQGTNWDNYKCSVLSYVNSKYPAQKITHFLINLFNSEEKAESSTIEASAESIFAMLMFFEDYLIEKGTEGVEWEYKYYTNTQSEADAAAREFMPVYQNMGYSLNPLSLGISTFFESDTERYKNTFDSVVELNSSRTIATEYTPIAVVSSSISSTGDGTTWGWKIDPDNDNQLIRVEGETSLEFPEYYDADDIIVNSIKQKIKDYLGYLPTNDTLVSFLFSTGYADVIYGEINFANKWVKDEQGKDVLVYDEEALKSFFSAVFLNANDLPKLDGTDDDQYQDIRNQDEAWNSNVEVWRPTVSASGKTAVLTSCNDDGRGCGRVTTQSNPDDYLAMELKSVRDYGLGSVLSYLEGRRVNFISGIAVSEIYDISGVYAWFYSYYMNNVDMYIDVDADASQEEIKEAKINEAKKQAQLALAGYYPSNLLFNNNITVKLSMCPYCGTIFETNEYVCNNNKCEYIDSTGQKFKTTSSTKYPLAYFAKSTNVYDGLGSVDNSSIIGSEFLPSDFVAISDGLNSLQGTGSSIFKYKKNNIEYWFTVTYASKLDISDKNCDNPYDSGYIVMMKKNPSDAKSKWIPTTMTATIPYLINSKFVEIFNAVLDTVENWSFGQDGYTDQDALNEASNQFFNPQAYYLAWFDYATNDKSNTASQDVINLITRSGFVSKYDTKTAERLRVLYSLNIDSDINSNDNPTVSENLDLSFNSISNVKGETWASSSVINLIKGAFKIGSIFDGAGKYTSIDTYSEFFETTSNALYGIELVDMAKTSKVYMIEEAVTFLGNFIYTYDTELLLAGDLYGREKIVSDLIFADRGYIISNYIFAVPVYSTVTEWTDTKYSDQIIFKGTDVLDTDSNLKKVYENNPCLDKNILEDNSWYVKLKDAFVVIGDALGVLDKNSENVFTKKYCTSNYSSKEELLYNYYQYYVAIEYEKTEEVDFCEVGVSDESNGGTQRGIKTECVYQPPIIDDSESSDLDIQNPDNQPSDDNQEKDTFDNDVDNSESNDEEPKGTYYLTKIKYSLYSKTYRDMSYTPTLYRNRWGTDGNRRVYYTGWSSAISDNSKYIYMWSYKIGTTHNVNKSIDFDYMVYIDTYDEVLQVYNELLRAANEETTDSREKEAIKNTAYKLFIGMKTFANLDDFALFGINSNVKNLISYHDYTSEENIRSSSYDPDMYSDWCINLDGDKKKCVTAAYGDTDHHYTVYDYEILKNKENQGFMNQVKTSIQTFLAKHDIFPDIYNNLEGRSGLLLGSNRIDSNGKLTNSPWFLDEKGNVIIDEYGNLNDSIIPVGNEYVSLSTDNFLLTQKDLERIMNAIHVVYALDYASETNLIISNDWNLDFDATRFAAPIELETKTGFSWNKEMRGTDGTEADKDYIRDCGAILVDYTNPLNCLVNYHWATGSYQSNVNNYKYYRDIYHSYWMLNESDLMLVGIEMGDRAEYGTPIALQTTFYGNEKQISPVETGVYFNEEVYNSWSSRMSFDEASPAKEKYLLDYRAATSTYLYDYLTNFEAYIPFGVMSDADLVNRGVDAYTAITSNSNRTFSYTSSYVSTIRKYLQTPGWQNLINNYNYIIPEKSSFLSSIATKGTTNVITDDVMVQYLAGLIETTFKYAPTWTIEYYNALIEEDNKLIKDDQKKKALIEREYQNYLAVEDAIYHSLYVTDTNETVQIETVKLQLTDGSYVDFPLIYLGYGAILAYDDDYISTKNYTNDKILGFGDTTLFVRSDIEDRLSLDKSIEFITIKFGKLLHKYGNVASATMAYFYGESYWDSMLEIAATQGLSTGPEWKNDDPELIQAAIELSMTKDIVWTDGVFKVDENYDSEYIDNIFTSEVVDYALSYVQDSEARIYLIRKTTSSLGSAISSIGSKASNTRDLLEKLVGDGISIVAPITDEFLFSYQFKDIYTIAETMDVDIGMLMSVIMASSDGNPCLGFGKCTKNEDDYILDALYRESYSNEAYGLLGIKGNSSGKDLYSSYFNENKDFKENCNYGYSYKTDTNRNINVITNNYDPDSKKCTTNVNVNLSLKETMDLPNGSFWYPHTIELGRYSSDSEKYETYFKAIKNYFKDDYRFRENGNLGLVYVTSKLAKIYDSTNQNALETLFIYFYGEEYLDRVKTNAGAAGYGSDWYSYFYSTTSKASNMVDKALQYYDATLSSEGKALEIKEKVQKSFIENLNDKVTKKSYYDTEYQKYVQEETTYKCAVSPTSGTCKRYYEIEKTINTAKEYCTREHLSQFVTEGTLKNFDGNPSFSVTNRVADVYYRFNYTNVSRVFAKDVYNKINKYLNSKGYSSTLEESFDQFLKNDAVITVNTTYKLDIDMSDYNGSAYISADTIALLDYYPELANITIKEFYELSNNVDKITEFNKKYDVSKIFDESTQTYHAIRHTSSTTGERENLNSVTIQYYELNKNSYYGSDIDECLRMYGDEKLFIPTDKVSYYGRYVVKDNDSVETIDLNVKFDVYGETINNSMNIFDPPAHISLINNSWVGEIYERGNCSFKYKYYTSTVESKDSCVRTKDTLSVVFEENENLTEKVYICDLETTKKIIYDYKWNLNINGFSVSAFSLYGDTSAFNEYMKDKLSMQNSGVELYVKENGNTRNDVDIIITSTLATEDDFLITADDYSLFAFFDNTNDSSATKRRSWFSPINDLDDSVDPIGTPNTYVHNEIWDFPVLKHFNTSPTRSNIITIVEHFGNEPDILNGGTKSNDGITLKVSRGDPIYSITSGIVVAKGYNPILGNYVEVQTNNFTPVVASVEGDRYQVTGMRIVYGYLLENSTRYSIGSTVTEGSIIGYAGNSGQTTGNQLYLAIYVECQKLDEKNNMIGSTGWLPVDPEPYFTAKFTSGQNYTVISK